MDSSCYKDVAKYDCLVCICHVYIYIYIYRYLYICMFVVKKTHVIYVYTMYPSTKGFKLGKVWAQQFGVRRRKMQSVRKSRESALLRIPM